MFYPPGFYEKIVDDPFKELGSVARLNLNHDTSTSGLAGVLGDLIANVPHQSNDIFLAIDTRDSVYPLSQNPGYTPFYWGRADSIYSVYNGTARNMGNWDWFSPLDSATSNQLVQSSLDPDIWYIQLRLKTGSFLYTNIYLSNYFGALEFQIGNYNQQGKQIIDDNRTTSRTFSLYFSKIGYQDLSSFYHLIAISNENNNLVCSTYLIGNDNLGTNLNSYAYYWTNGGNLGVWPFTAPANSYYITPDKKGVGLKINGLNADWSLQSEGLQKIPAGTKLRIIWENVPVHAPNSQWTNWPGGAYITGDQTFFNTNNQLWQARAGTFVTIDTNQGKAKVDLEIPADILPGINFKMVCPLTQYGIWENRPHFALLPQPRDGWITVIVDLDDFVL